MALIDADTMGHYPTANINAKYTQVYSSFGSGSSFTVSATDSARGGPCFKGHVASNSQAAGSVNIVPDITPSGDTCIFGMRFKHNNPFVNLQTGTTENDGLANSGSNVLFSCRLNGTTQVWFRLNTTGTISALRGTSVLGTSTLALTQGVYTYLEFKIKINSSTGTIDVKQDGITTLLALTGINTQGASSAAWNEIKHPLACSNAGAFDWFWHDYYLFDGTGSNCNDFLGDSRGDCLFVNAAGDVTGWTPDSGSNWARVSETSFDGDSSYVAASTAATIDTYKTGNQPVPGANILFMQITIGAKKTDAGSAGLKPVVRISGSNNLGTERGVPSSYKFIKWPYALNPATGVAWVDGDIGASQTQFGIDKST